MWARVNKCYRKSTEWLFAAIDKGGAQRMKYTRVKLGGHQAYGSRGASAVHVVKAELLRETAQKVERNILKQ